MDTILSRMAAVYRVLRRVHGVRVIPLFLAILIFFQRTTVTIDPAQRKMMMYMMPVMFTVFMLFLPAGLGVYMFTNSVLAIVQQQAVEQHAKKSLDRGQVEVSVRPSTSGDKSNSKSLTSGPKASTKTKGTSA